MNQQNEMDEFQEDDNGSLEKGYQPITKKEKKQPKERSGKTFIPAVSHYVRRNRSSLSSMSTEDGVYNGGGDYPFASKLQNMTLYRKQLAHPIEFYVKNIDTPQHVSMGSVKATIGTSNLTDLKNATAYMIMSNMITMPDNFEAFEDLKENTGGKDILLHEIFKEPSNVWEDYYQILGRVKPTETLSHQKTKKIDLDELPDNYDSTHMSSQELFKHIKNENMGFESLDYNRLPRDPKRQNKLVKPYYSPVDLSNGLLETNQGSPLDDPTVYLKYPVRQLGGKFDHKPDDLVDLCSNQVSRYFSKTAKETDRFPELMRYQENRNSIGNFKRNMCPSDESIVRPLLEKMSLGQEWSKPNSLDPKSESELLAMGYSRKELDNLYGPEALVKKVDPSSVSAKQIEMVNVQKVFNNQKQPPLGKGYVQSF